MFNHDIAPRTGFSLHSLCKIFLTSCNEIYLHRVWGRVLLNYCRHHNPHHRYFVADAEAHFYGVSWKMLVNPPQSRISDRIGVFKSDPIRYRIKFTLASAEATRPKRRAGQSFMLATTWQPGQSHHNFLK